VFNLGDAGLVGGVLVPAQQGAQLQGVQLEAGLVHRLRVPGRVLVHGEQRRRLGNHRPRIATEHFNVKSRECAKKTHYPESLQS